MNIPRLAAGIAAVYLVIWGVAAFLHMVVFAAQFAEYQSVMRPADDMSAVMLWVLLAHLVQVGAFAVIFVKGYEGRGIMEGVRFGILGGLLLGATELVWALALPLSLSTAFLSFATSFVMWLIGGVLLALIYKPKTVDAQAA